MATRTPEHNTDGRKALAEITARKPGHPPKITQSVIAGKLGISQPSVSEWVSGKSRPTPPFRAALESLLGIPATAWLTPKERGLMERAQSAGALAATGTDDPRDSQA